MRRFFRFRLSTFLLAIVCFAIAFAWWKDHEQLRQKLDDAEVWRQVLRDADVPDAWAESLKAPREPPSFESSFALAVDVKELQQPTVAKAAALLSDVRRDVRIMAVWQLGEMHTPDTADQIFPHLSRAIGDSNYRVRREAAAALTRIGGPTAIAILEDALTLETDAETSRRITGALYALRLPLRLRDELEDPDPEVRYKAARQLRGLEPAEGAPAVPTLLDVLDDSEAQVRSEVAQAIGKLAAPDAAVPVLLRAFRREPDANVRRTLATILARLEGKR